MTRIKENYIDQRNLKHLVEQAIGQRYFDLTIPEYARCTQQLFSEPELESFRNFKDWLSEKDKRLRIATSGSWRNINQEVVDDNAKATRYILSRGFGVLHGQAIGSDFISTEVALDEILKNRHIPADYLMLVLPAQKLVYMERLSQAATEEDEFVRTQATSLNSQLRWIDERYPEIIFDNYAPAHIDEDRFLHLNEHDYRKDIYHWRNNLIAFAADGMVAFRTNDSGGVFDNYKKILDLRRPVLVQEYSITTQETIDDYDHLKIPGVPKRCYENSSLPPPLIPQALHDSGELTI